MSNIKGQTSIILPQDKQIVLVHVPQEKPQLSNHRIRQVTLHTSMSQGTFRVLEEPLFVHIPSVDDGQNLSFLKRQVPLLISFIVIESFKL